MTRVTAIAGWRRLPTMLVVAVLSAAPVAADDARSVNGSDTLVVASTAQVSTAHPGAEGITVRVMRGDGGLEVEGHFAVAAPASVAWAVLTDYDGIDRFVSSMRESRVESHRHDSIMVHQEAVGRLFLFKRRMHTTLEVREEPPDLIRFEDVLHKDFEHYRGEWRIENHGAEVEIVYRLEANPTVSIPDVFARGMFERSARRLLLEVEREIVSRATEGS